MEFLEAKEFVQQHFTDGLVMVVGSGLSAAEGMPGMPQIAHRLRQAASGLSGDEARRWQPIEALLAADEGLESALLKCPPSSSLEEWIVKEVCNFLIPGERSVISEVLSGARTLRLTKLLRRILKPANGLPILTPNYDRLVEVACEMAGFHVDTTAIGVYAGAFDFERSCMASCKSVVKRGGMTILEHFPRAVVLKPHGSFDWYRTSDGGRRCTLDLHAERLVITPGLNKYRAGYDAPFDKHRELANNYINQAARLAVFGYGFNDDHLQTHLLRRIRDGVPTLILNRTANLLIQRLVNESPACVCFSEVESPSGVRIIARDGVTDYTGPTLWDLGVLVQELLT